MTIKECLQKGPDIRISYGGEDGCFGTVTAGR